MTKTISITVFSSSSLMQFRSHPRTNRPARLIAEHSVHFSNPSCKPYDDLRDNGGDEAAGLSAFHSEDCSRLYSRAVSPLNESGRLVFRSRLSISTRATP